MKYVHFILPMICVLGFSSFAYAQDVRSEPGAFLTDRNVCFEVENTAPYTVFGNVATAKITDPETGQIITHTATFRLAPGEKEPMCSNGPFFEGQKLRFTLRTLVPVFECKTAVYPGSSIIIRGERGSKDYEGTKTWIDCN
jgi:hypothetical protein